MSFLAGARAFLSRPPKVCGFWPAGGCSARRNWPRCAARPSRREVEADDHDLSEEWFTHVKTSRFLAKLLKLSSHPAAGICPDAHFPAFLQGGETATVIVRQGTKFRRSDTRRWRPRRTMNRNYRMRRKHGRGRRSAKEERSLQDY